MQLGIKRNFKVMAAVLTAVTAAAGSAAAASTPTVVTGAVSNASNTAVKLHGTVNPEGSATRYSFQFGLTNLYGLSSPVQARSVGRGTRPVAVTTTASGLIPGTVYHYRITATNGFGTSLGRDRTLRTTGHPPAIVVTGPTFGLPTSSGAAVTGSINPNNEATGYQFEYGVSTGYGLFTAPGLLPASNSLQSVHVLLGGLSAGTTFHYQLIASHPGHPPTYGGDQAFTTLPSPRPVPATHARTTPPRARNKPYVFTTSGTIVPPASLPLGVTCGSGGTVAIRFFLAHRTRAFRTTQLKPDCTFLVQTLFHRLIGKGRRSTRLRIELRFRGNPYLASGRTQVQRVHLG